MGLYGIVRLVVGPVVRILWRLRVEGMERIPAGPVIVVANHDSLADPFFLGAAIDRPLRFLTKSELWSSRVVGWVLDAARRDSRGAPARGRGGRRRRRPRPRRAVTPSRSSPRAPSSANATGRGSAVQRGSR